MHARPQKLILWDIDGTLLFGDRAGERALLVSLQRVFGIEGSITGIELAGRTDRYIAENLLRAHGIEPSPNAVHDFLEGYLAALPEEMSRGKPRLLPGIFEALSAVAARPAFAQGLLTGNLERGAKLKLQSFDVWHFFPFGAYADDSMHRNDLGVHALRRAGVHHTTDFAPENTIVVGDTPHDIACGKAIEAATVAVATGRFTVHELRACAPTIVFSDFSDVSGFLAFLDSYDTRDEKP